MQTRKPLPTNADSLSIASNLALTALARFQRPDGSWEGEFVWCPVITAQAVVVQVITQRDITQIQRDLLLRHFEVTRCPDGGWGLHPESTPYRFVTTLVYVAARLLGAPPDQPMLQDARAFLARQKDGVFSLPQWGKLWLSFIGLYDRDGLNPCPPELFLLPQWLPFSPLRFYCHTRYIYLAMSFLAGSRYQADLGPITAELRAELYGDSAPEQAARHRHDLAASDVYVYPGTLLKVLYDAGYYLGRFVQNIPGAASIRRRALDACLERIRFEQCETNHQGISPVSGILNSLALFSRDPKGDDTQASLAGIETWRWDDETRGSRYAGGRSTTWDTSFAIQAFLAGGREAALQNVVTLRAAYRRLVEMQITSEIAGTGHARDTISGGWCFSDGVHRWPVSDCAAEAVIALLDCDDIPGLIPESERLSDTRLRQASNFILSRQNKDGGFGTFERRRGSRFLETLNPSEMFGQCMTELSYLECTASSVRALIRLRRRGTVSSSNSVSEAIARGVKVILDRQRPDGSWPGFWGINFIYGTCFAVAALRDAGLPSDHVAFVHAKHWLEQTQHPDGGWGEHFSGCLSNSYVDNSTSLIISTAWGCLALLHSETGVSPSVRRGMKYLLDRRSVDGSWPREGVNGVFFGTAMVEYTLYNNYFPAMALRYFESRTNGMC